MTIDPKKLNFQDWDFKTWKDEDGFTHTRAEYYFEDENGEKIRGTSPAYTQGESDYDCLLEDAPRVAAELQNGKTWDEVVDTFREAW